MTEIFDIPQDEKHLRIVAHRGTTVFARENTLAAFEYAGKRHSWAIETDLRLTRDNEIVCIHDGTLDRSFNVSAKVSELTLAELRHIEPDESLRVPTFFEYLELCERYGSIPFIEIKDEVVERTVDILKKRGLIRRSVISSSDFTHLSEARELDPDIFVHHIFSSTDHIERLARLGSAGMAFNIVELDQIPNGLIERVHAEGLKVCLRAGDTEERVKKMLALGLDYIPSNRIYEICQ